MSVVPLLSLTACGSTAPSAPAATAVPTAEPTEEPTEKGAGQPEDTGTETPAENGKTLVVYFSATGSTRREPPGFIFDDHAVPELQKFFHIIRRIKMRRAVKPDIQLRAEKLRAVVPGFALRQQEQRVKVAVLVV